MTLRSLPLAALAAALVLSGCVGKEARLRAGLEQAGLGESMARCMAKPMAERLSIDELKRLQVLVEELQQRPHDTFIIEIRALGDARILAVTSYAALHCALP